MTSDAIVLLLRFGCLATRHSPLMHNGNERILHIRQLAGFGLGVSADFGRCALGQDFSRIENDNAVAILGFFHEVSGDDDGHAVLGQIGDTLPKFAAGKRVGAAGGFVQEKDFRLVQERRRHRQPLLETARQLAARQFGQGCQLEVLHRPVDALAFAVAAQIVSAGEEFEVFGDGELTVERELLGHVADALAGRGAGMARSPRPPRATCRRWPGAGRRSCERSSSCRRRSGRASRRFRRGGRRN